MKVQIFSEVTLDGKLSMKKNYSSKNLLDNLNENEMRFIHDCRGKVDGILIGRNTVTIDDPSLTNRFGSGKQPDRIVISNSLSFTFNESIFKNDAHTIIVTSEKKLKHPAVDTIYQLGHECIFVGGDFVDFGVLFQRLENEKGYESIMIEGGGTVINNVLELNLVDEIIILRLPIITFQNNAPNFVECLKRGKRFVKLKMKNVVKYDSFFLESYEVLK